MDDWIPFAITCLLGLVVLWLLGDRLNQADLLRQQRRRIERLEHEIDRMRGQQERSDKTFRTWAGIVAKPQPEEKPQDADLETYLGRGHVQIHHTTKASERPVPRPPGWSGW